MKQLYLLFFMTLVIGLVASSQIATQFTTYKMGGANSDAFTTNSFKCIAVGKGNRIWAGTQYGGLYTYDDDGLNIWRKSDKLTDVFINDIKADPDSGIWIAQSGRQSMGGNSNIAGGVNLFRVASDLSMEFYSVLGTTTSADLQSRNAKGIYIDPTYKASRGLLPRPWVVQGSYISSFNTLRGGLNVGLNPTAPFFRRITDGFSTAAGTTSICEAIGGNSEEVWVAVRQNGPAPQILRYNTVTGAYKDAYTSSNVPELPSSFIAQAIHFDAVGNKWIGLKAGGLVIKTPSGWMQFNSESKIPPGTAVNYNAIISDEFGNVYIGTSSGLLEFQSPIYYASSTPDNVNAYTLYTTAEGLPSNNITGLAYDKKNGRILITSDGGVTFMDQKPAYIKGVVLDVAAGLYKEKPYPGYVRLPLKAGVTVTLLKDGIEEEVIQPDDNGIFELKKAADDKVYTVEVRYIKDGRPIRYIYNNIRNHTLMQPTLIPNGLLDELKVFKDSMQSRCFPIKITAGIELNLSLFCVNAFDVGSYNLAVDPFFDAGGISNDHTKRVDNLANYYTSMAAVYNLGGSATDLSTDVAANMIDAIEAEKGFSDLGDAIVKNPNVVLGPNDDVVKEGIKADMKLLREGISLCISATAAIFPESKTQLEQAKTFFDDASDLIIEVYDKGMAGGAKKLLIDNVKKFASTSIGTLYYKFYYTGELHEDFVFNASNSAKYLLSDYSFADGYDKLYNPNANSIVKLANDTLKNRKDAIANLALVAKYTDLGSSILDAASLITAAIPGAQGVAVVTRNLSYVAKAAKTVSLVSAMAFAAAGASEISDLSTKIRPGIDFMRTANANPSKPTGIMANAADSLLSKKNVYNQRLTELQAVYNMAYNDANYKAAYRRFFVADSLYTLEMTRTMNGFWAAADSAVKNIPGFGTKLTHVVDSFASVQYTLRQSLHMQNISYRLDSSNRSNYVAGIDSIANEIKMRNDSAIAGIADMFTSIVNSGAIAPAYLVLDDYKISHSHAPGSTATVTYTFKNYGGQSQNNVSLKLKDVVGGYTIVGIDSFYVGTVAAGQSRQVSFSLKSPTTDSTGYYNVDVKASNGRVLDVSGTLYTVDPNKFFSVKNGNWNDPATWSANAVPGAGNPVYISHNVTVTADGACKGLSVVTPGTITVNTGKKININK